MHLGLYFIFAQPKATLRAGWKGVEVGGERSDDREAIFLHRCLGKLAVLSWLKENTIGEATSLNGISPGGSSRPDHLLDVPGSYFAHPSSRKDELYLAGLLQEERDYMKQVLTKGIVPKQIVIISSGFQCPFQLGFVLSRLSSRVFEELVAFQSSYGWTVFLVHIVGPSLNVSRLTFWKSKEKELEVCEV